MGQVKIPKKVRLFCALCYTDPIIRDRAIEILENDRGTIIETSQPFDFDYTNYYSAEMGENLKKEFLVFGQLIDPVFITGIKLRTNAIEEELSLNGKRRVNIDPGYLEAAKIVLATTKNFSHRIYIGNGIYGDVQLYYRDGHYNTNEWTYPDYKTVDTITFFDRIRKEYLNIISK